MTPELRQNLQEALRSAFNPKQLLQFATVHLAFDDVKFADVLNFNQSSTDIAFDLVQSVEQRGHEAELVLKLQEERPKLPQVIALVSAFGLPATRAARSSKIPDVVHDAVIRFNEKFQQRQEQIGYLNANKDLHDLLHHLQDLQGLIKSTVAAIHRPSGEPPDMDGIIDPLTVWVVQGQESVKKTEFPKEHKLWITDFSKAVNDLRAELSKSDTATIEVPKLDRAIEILANLPAQEQRSLNTELVKCATRLKTDELVGLIDRILIELGKAGVVGAETHDLRAGVGSFRISCRALTDLIDEHNLCQEVDGALREADGLPEVAADRLSQWAEIKGWLQEIAKHHPGSLPDDIRAKRPFESAREFEEACAAVDKARAKNRFQRLKERFGDLFLNTDTALLRITQELLASAQTLDATLRRFQ